MESLFSETDEDGLDGTEAVDWFVAFFTSFKST